MYRVEVEHECGCFRKSEYQKEKSFENAQDAFTYSKILEELMNEEFCSKHHFFVQKANENHYMIRVVDHPSGGGDSCSTGSCGDSCGC